MNIWNRLITAMRHHVNKPGAAFADHEVLGIIDEEIHIAAEELKQLRESLTQTALKQKTARELLQTYVAKIAEYDGYGVKALQTGNEELALEVAAQIAGLEDALAFEEQQLKELEESAVGLRKNTARIESGIKRLKQQANLVKAAQSVQKAQMAVAARYGGSNARLQTAVDCMQRMRSRQAVPADTGAEDLALRLDEDRLKAKLTKAGIISGNANAEAVLARLRQKAQAA